MLITIIVGLITSRVVLNALGFTDYGIYNVVGGVVTMMAFLNVGMSGASQRFISYELGKGNKESLKNTFCTSVITHAAIALLVVLVMESVGIWFLNYKLNIPPERLLAANWVFQCSIFTFAVTVISVPYNADIIAHEKMGAFAYVSVYEAIMKLIIAYCIYKSPIDKLILYSSLVLCVQISVRLLYSIYCKKHFEECTFKVRVDKKLFKEMFAFAGWGCIGNMGFTTKDQGSNILLNLFFGTTVNAARGIAGQVNSIISSFASNFTMAMNPQVIKLYAAGEYEKSRELVYAGSKYAFLLLCLIAVPFLTNEHYLLRLWLGNVPEYTDIFVFIILVCSLIYSMSNTVSTAIMATGHVKWFQIGLATILLMEIPIAFIILKMGGTPYQAMLPSVFTNFASIIYRIVLIRKLIPGYDIMVYCKKTIAICFTVFIVSMTLSYVIRRMFNDNFINFIITTFISLVIVVFTIYFIGLNSRERLFVTNKLHNYIHLKK